MKSIRIRGVPDETYASLQARAAATGHSLAEFLLLEVKRIARRPPLAEALRDAQDRYWGVGAGEAVATLRALRDERS